MLVGFQLRFHPCLVRAHELISSGGLGRIMSAHMNFSEYLPAWHPWEDYRQGYAARADLGGGVLLTQCHSLDYLPWLAGEVESVWGILAKVSDLVIDVEDTVEIGLRFTSGATGSLHLDFARQPPSHHIEISGTRGFMECDLVQGVLRLYQAENGEWQEFHLPDQWERNVMFLDEMKHFIDVVRGDAVPLCKLEDGIHVMQIISAIRASDSEQRLIRLRS